MDLDPVSATDQQLIAFCKENRRSDARVVKLSDSTIIKFGIDVTVAEFANQRYVWEHTSSSTFRIPQPIRFFQDTSLGQHLIIGYLVMEFIYGQELSTYLQTASPSEREQIVDGVLQALKHLGNLQTPQGQGPGPLGHGPLRGYLWSDSGINATFKTISDLENFLNTIARFGSGTVDKIDLTSDNLVMCHGDLAPRNILKLDDGGLALLDWATAGFYPPLFEIYAIRTRMDREPIFQTLISKLPQEPRLEKQIQFLASIERILLRHGDVINLKLEGHHQHPIISSKQGKVETLYYSARLNQFSVVTSASEPILSLLSCTVVGRC